MAELAAGTAVGTGSAAAPLLLVLVVLLMLILWHQRSWTEACKLLMDNREAGLLLRNLHVGTLLCTRTSASQKGMS